MFGKRIILFLRLSLFSTCNYNKGQMYKIKVFISTFESKKCFQLPGNGLINANLLVSRDFVYIVLSGLLKMGYIS